MVSLIRRIEDGAYRLRRSEAGGPVIGSTPSRRGFGTALAERSVAGEPDRILKHDWAPDGLVTALRVPLTNLGV